MKNTEQAEMRFSPRTGEVKAHSHNDLINAGIYIPVQHVAEKWGTEAATEYQAWQAASIRIRTESIASEEQPEVRAALPFPTEEFRA